MEAHEYAKLFPMATTQEITDMSEDIKARGLLTPIVMLDGKILDGRNRAAACKLAGVVPRTTEYTGTDPLADVVSWNLHRRQLTTSQRAVLADELRPMFEERARARQTAGLKRGTESPVIPNLGERENKTTSTAEAARAAGVGHSSVEAVGFVKKHAPELVDKIKTGEMTVNKAQKEVKQRLKETQPKPPKQQEITEAMQYAGMAISQLTRIRPDDPKKQQALAKVTNWIKEQ